MMTNKIDLKLSLINSNTFLNVCATQDKERPRLAYLPSKPNWLSRLIGWIKDSHPSSNLDRVIKTASNIAKIALNKAPLNEIEATLLQRNLIVLKSKAEKHNANWFVRVISFFSKRILCSSDTLNNIQDQINQLETIKRDIIAKIKSQNPKDAPNPAKTDPVVPESLSLNETPDPGDVSNMGLSALADCESLKELDLLKIDEDEKKTIEFLKPLQELNFDSMGIPEKEFESISSGKSLKELNLSDCTIAEDELKHLESFPNLKSLQLSNVSITPEFHKTQSLPASFWKVDSPSDYIKPEFKISQFGAFNTGSMEDTALKLEKDKHLYINLNDTKIQLEENRVIPLKFLNKGAQDSQKQIIAAHSSLYPSPPTPSIPRPLEDADYGREEYIDDCVNKVKNEGYCLVTFGGFFSLNYLPPILQYKYAKKFKCKSLDNSVFFPGFTYAHEEIAKKLNELGIKFTQKEFLNGSNSDALGYLGTSNNVDGYTFKKL